MNERPRPIQCQECELPAARLVGRCLVIESRHHGRKHTTIITFEQLRRWMHEVEKQDCAA